MPLLLVTFDPGKPEQDYSDLKNEIKSYSNVRLSESSYAIITDKTPSVVCEEMKNYIDADDNIYIINLKRPYEAYGSELVTDWLKKGIKRLKQSTRCILGYIYLVQVYRSSLPQPNKRIQYSYPNLFRVTLIKIVLQYSPFLIISLYFSSFFLDSADCFCISSLAILEPQQ